MLADLDLVLIYVFCIADDLLPKQAVNHRRSPTDAEVVTLAVAQAIMGIASDYRFINTATNGWGTCSRRSRNGRGSIAAATGSRTRSRR